MATTSFRAVIAKAGLYAFVDVPAQVTRAFTAFAEHGRVRVAGAINGQQLHATLVPTRGGAHRLYVNAGMRSAAGIEVGDRVTLELRALRCDEVGVPNDLARKLAKARLQRHFDVLSASHRRELVRLGRDFPKDPADRIIAATARCHGLWLMTADENVRRWAKAPVI